MVNLLYLLKIELAAGKNEKSLPTITTSIQ